VIEAVRDGREQWQQKHQQGRKEKMCTGKYHVPYWGRRIISMGMVKMLQTVSTKFIA